MSETELKHTPANAAKAPAALREALLDSRRQIKAGGGVDIDVVLQKLRGDLAALEVELATAPGTPISDEEPGSLA